MRVLWLILLFAACTPTYIVLGGTADGGEEASLVVDAARIDAVASDVPVVLDVPVLLDTAIVDRPIVLDQGMVIDRPSLPDVVTTPDVVATRDVVLVSDTSPPWPFGLRPGDRIKARSSSTVYLFGSDGRHHAFFNEDVYYSWFLNQTGIIELSDRDFAQIPRGSIITIRPGTWLITTPRVTPRTYAVERCGVRRWIASESLAPRLFGPNWNVGTSPQGAPVPGARRTRDLNDTYFDQYQEGVSITTPVHPNGSLIRYAGNSERYLVWNGLRRRITPEGFIANRFNEAFLSVADIAYADGAPITGYEPLLSDPMPCLP